MVGKKDEGKWKLRLKELKAYKQKHGDCLVPQNYEPNVKLGKWVGHQRQEYKKWLKGVYAKITQERIDQLNEIDFVWEVGRASKPNDTLWKLRLKELRAYKRKHGDCLVPANYEQNNIKLGSWVACQRREYKKWLKGLNAFITQDRIDQLNKIDFVWEGGKSHPNDALWKQRLNELVKYKKKHGDCLVPRNYKHNAKLGNWVNNQRQFYKKWLNGVHSQLTQERIDQLNEIDFVCEIGTTSKPNDTLWRQHLKELKAYKKKHGDCLVSTLDEDNAKLGNWVSNQRQHYKKWLKGKSVSITQERIDQLNEIDFVWEVGQRDDTLWEQRFNELVKYKTKHGDCLVPNRYKQNAKLGKWVSTQRQEYKKWLKGAYSQLTQHRIDQLNEIDFVWEGKRGRKSKEFNKSNQVSSIPSVRRCNVASTKSKSNRPRKRQIPSKDQPKKRRLRRQSQDVGHELSPSERIERRRLMLQALKNWRNPMRPVQEFLSDDF